jgi:hypothetical protein
MGQLTIGGSLAAGPPQGVSNGFPGGRITIPLAFAQSSEGLAFNVATGILSRNVNSPGSFVALQGVGPTDTVTKGAFLYFKSATDIDLRITLDDGSGGDTVITPMTINGGPFIWPFSASKFLKLLEVKGSGLVEYFVCGLS